MLSKMLNSQAAKLKARWKLGKEELEKRIAGNEAEACTER
jgi:hypothetical protein